MSKIKGVSKEVIEELRKIPTGTLSDAVDELDLKGFMTGVRPFIEGVKIVGPAVTVRFVRTYRKDYELSGLEHLLRAVDESKPGSVIVLGCEVKDVAIWGGLLATASRRRGIEGAVMDGATRDVSEIRELGFPVFAGTVNPSTTGGRIRSVSLNEPIECGGVYVNPDDIIVGDDDGIVVIPSDKVNEVLESARKMETGERAMAEALKKGLSIIQSLKKIGRI